MPVNAGDLIQLSWKGNCFGQRIMLIRNYRVSGTGGSTQPTGQTLAQIIDYMGPGGTAGFTEQYLNCLANQYTLDEIRAQVVRPTRSAFAARSYGDVPGTGGATQISNSQGAITLRTANAGRNQVSTVKIGPLPAIYSNVGYISAVGRVQLLSMLDFLATSYNVTPPGITLAPIIWHAPGLTYDALIGGSVWDQSRVMVRRTVGRGE